MIPTPGTPFEYTGKWRPRKSAACIIRWHVACKLELWLYSCACYCHGMMTREYVNAYKKGK